MLKQLNKLTWRLFGARSIAVLAAVVAASWGPTALSVRVAVSVSSDAVSTCRLVLANSCDSAPKTKETGTKKTGAQKTGRSSVCFFNAIPESLENAQLIHFDCITTPTAPEQFIACKCNQIKSESLVVAPCATLDALSQSRAPPELS